MAATINKDMIIADMLKIDPGIAAILMASGMHCIGCPSAQGETLDEAAMVHGMNADELVVNVMSIWPRKRHNRTVFIVNNHKKAIALIGCPKD